MKDNFHRGPEQQPKQEVNPGDIYEFAGSALHLGELIEFDPFSFPDPRLILEFVDHDIDRRRAWALSGSEKEKFEMARELVKRMGFDHYELARAYIEGGPELDIHRWTKANSASQLYEFLKALLQYESAESESIKHTIESANEANDYKPEDLKNFPLPETSGLIPHRTALLYMNVISGYGQHRHSRYQVYYLITDGTKLSVDMSYWPDPIWPIVESIDFAGLKRCYISETLESDRASKHMEETCAFNIQKLIANKIKPGSLPSVVQESSIS